MRPTAKLTWIEVKLFLREPLAVIFAFAFPFFVLFVLAGVFGNDLDDADPEDIRVWRGVGPTDYYVPAYIGLVMASLGLISLPLRLATYREQGILRRYRAAGMPLAAIFGSQVIVAVAMAVIGGAGIAVVSSLVYGTEFAESWPGVAGAFAVSVLAFCAVGLMLGGVLPTARAAQGGGLILFFVMMFISGAGPPREVLAGGMKAFSEGLLLTHVIIALQDPWLGYGWNWTRLGVTAAFGALCLAVAAWRFRWE
ncbi:MAG: ABC transporter permease [Dehalococcoidia bacterium]